MALALGFRPVVHPYTVVRVRRTQVRLPRPLQGPDHVQLTLFNWDTERVLTLNKKLQVNLRGGHFWRTKSKKIEKNFKIFYCSKTFVRSY